MRCQNYMEERKCDSASIDFNSDIEENSLMIIVSFVVFTYIMMNRLDILCEIKHDIRNSFGFCLLPFKLSALFFLCFKHLEKL